MIKLKNIIIKCMAKDCEVKIIITCKIIIIDKKEKLEPKEMLNFCPRHQEQFGTKLIEIKKHFTKSQLENILAKNIATNVVESFLKNNKKKTPN